MRESSNNFMKTTSIFPTFLTPAAIKSFLMKTDIFTTYNTDKNSIPSFYFSANSPLIWIVQEIFPVEISRWGLKKLTSVHSIT